MPEPVGLLEATQKVVGTDPNRPRVKFIVITCGDCRFMPEVSRKAVAEKYDVQPDEVLVLTFLGPDLQLSTDTVHRQSAHESLQLAFANWDIEGVVVVGHEGCRANPVPTKAEHCTMMWASCYYITSAFSELTDLRVEALYFRSTTAAGKHRSIISRFWNVCRNNLARVSHYGWVPEWVDKLSDFEAQDVA